MHLNQARRYHVDIDPENGLLPVRLQATARTNAVDHFEQCHRKSQNVYAIANYQTDLKWYVIPKHACLAPLNV